MKRRGLQICSLIVLPFLLLILAVLAGLRINTTASFPVGFYWAIGKSPDKNDLIFFSPPTSTIFDLALQRGYIGSGFQSGRYESMLKRIAAVAGDTVSIDPTGVTINGQHLVNSEPRTTDLGGRPMPPYALRNYCLATGEVFLLSNSPVSFDSRYFGPMPRSYIQTVVRPLLTW